jgi:hypothetical protein
MNINNKQILYNLSKTNFEITLNATVKSLFANKTYTNTVTLKAFEQEFIVVD